MHSLRNRVLVLQDETQKRTFDALCILCQAQAAAFASARAPVIIHRRRSRATMAASASSAQEDEHSHSSTAESAAEICANADGNSELQAGKPTAPNSIETALVANRSHKKRMGQGPASRRSA